MGIIADNELKNMIGLFFKNNQIPCCSAKSTNGTERNRTYESYHTYLNTHVIKIDSRSNAKKTELN